MLGVLLMLVNKEANRGNKDFSDIIQQHDEIKERIQNTTDAKEASVLYAEAELLGCAITDYFFRDKE